MQDGGRWVDQGTDAYRVLQVDPAAEPGVIHAAYRALARIYHPDGSAPDAARVAAINRAWSLIGSAEARLTYDAHRRLRATGPGFVAGHGGLRPSDAPPAPRPRYDAWAQSRAAAAPARSDSSSRVAAATAGTKAAGEIVLDFGRYAGWRLVDVLRHDADYLRWLCRQSAGLRYREQILRLLPNEPDLDRRSKSVA
jgi:curved DNA-binding protein CbpA